MLGLNAKAIPASLFHRYIVAVQFSYRFIIRLPFFLTTGDNSSQVFIAETYNVITEESAASHSFMDTYYGTYYARVRFGFECWRSRFVSFDIFVFLVMETTATFSDHQSISHITRISVY